MTRLLILATMLATNLHAQQTVDEPGELRVFLDCDACDAAFMRTEIPWVAFMRDRTDADVHILVTTIQTGSGGRQYTINIIGQREPLRSDTLRFVSEPNQASAAVREGLTRAIQYGLMPYVLRTPQAGRITLSFRQPAAGADAPRARATDPWHAWVYNIGGETDIEKEQRQSDLEFNGRFSANRVTDQWKIGISSYGEINRSTVEFERDGVLQKRTARRDEYSGGGVVIRSLGQHWGVGAQATIGSSTFQNIRLATRSAAAVEYSVWPYAEATRRQLTLQYSLGVSSFRYIELTIFDKLRETRPTQSFVAGYDTRQQWGESSITLETASFLDDLSQFRLEFEADTDIRLFRGFSLSVGAGATFLRDQIAIVKDLDPDDVLQELRELQTDFRYELRVGVSYSFGSIFNSVVNPRFGGGTGRILR
jgi:hypothetical protein